MVKPYVAVFQKVEASAATCAECHGTICQGCMNKTHYSHIKEEDKTKRAGWFHLECIPKGSKVRCDKKRCKCKIAL